MEIPESRRRKLDLLLRKRPAGEIISGRELLERFGHGAVNLPRPDDVAKVTDDAAPLPALPRPAAVVPGMLPILPALTGQPMLLTDACPGCEKIDATGRRCWLITKPLAGQGDELTIARDYAAVLAGARQNFDELAASVELCHAANASPPDLLFMDTETCGLAGTMIFLVGLMKWIDGRLVIEQYLARDYAEEAAILDGFNRQYEQARVLVTFNGKSFDMTQIRERSAFHGLDVPWAEPPHLDLLHEARRRWKGQLRRFSLQHLEWRLLGRHRLGDIPGAAIPDAYHDFVRTGDARRLRDILHHNLLDLLTMAQLVTILLTACDPAPEAEKSQPSDECPF